MAKKNASFRGINDANLAKVIKQSASIGVAVVEENKWLLTNGHWMLYIVPSMHKQAVAAITQRLGLVQASPASWGSIRVSTNDLQDVFKDWTEREGEEAVITRWMYEGIEGNLLRAVQCKDRVILFQQRYMDMFDVDCSKKITSGKSAIPGTRGIVFSFAGEPVGFVVEVSNKKGVRPPEIIE